MFITKSIILFFNTNHFFFFWLSAIHKLKKIIENNIILLEYSYLINKKKSHIPQKRQNSFII